MSKEPNMASKERRALGFPCMKERNKAVRAALERRALICQ